MTIGQHGELLTFDKAKKRARGILADALRIGQDPVGERRAGRTAPNMAGSRVRLPRTPCRSQEAALRAFEMIVPCWRTLSSPRLEPRRLRRSSAGISRSMHLRLSDRPYQANRMLALISKMLNLAVEWSWRGGQSRQGDPSGYREEKRDRWLTDEELSRLVRVLEKLTQIFARPMPFDSNC